MRATGRHSLLCMILRNRAFAGEAYIEGPPGNAQSRKVLPRKVPSANLSSTLVRRLSWNLFTIWKKDTRSTQGQSEVTISIL